MKKLGDDLKSAQASNLINAQNDFYFRNAGTLVADGGKSADARLNFNLGINDNAAAGDQWTKLQQAQEIVTAKVQPLRVNLPVRGQRVAFSQVLQTEGGQPMTFRLAAENTKLVHWPVRLAACAAAFLTLWVLVAVLSRATRRNPRLV